MIAVLSPDEIERLLQDEQVGRLAVLAEGEPYVVPVTYAYGEGCLYAHAVLGRKLAALRAHPRVGFEVDARDGQTWRSVVAEAVFEELTDPAARRAALAHLSGKQPAVLPVGVPGVVFRLRLTATSGRLVRTRPPVAPGEAPDRPLLGIDLRAGDDRNYPPPEG
jgi:uncharacterized protein